jgi:hypothetical protein
MVSPMVRRGGALVLLLSFAAPAFAIVAGGGPAKSDCYAVWQVTTPDLAANHGKIGVDCQDGDRSCDVDGQVDGTCTVGVSICVAQPGLARCTPSEVTAIKLSRRTAALGLTAPPVPATAFACGPATLLRLALRSAHGRQRPSRPIRLAMTAKATVKPRKDSDQLVLRCVPNAGGTGCPANPSGGASQLAMAIASEGTDLDNGWSGLSHNFPVVFGTEFRMCLAGCDATATSVCTENETATEQANGPTFGPPIPLFAAGVPTCLVNRFGSPKMTGGTADLATGAVTAMVNLRTDVFLTSATQVCPRCSGATIGATGTCDSGARQGQACRTEGTVRVGGAVGNASYTLSADCVPPGTPTGTLTIGLPLGTGTSTLSGPRPCGASVDDECNGSACNATCTGNACVSTTTAGQCVDRKGGVSQVCCASDTTRPCFPTAGGGAIVRPGAAAVPTPAWPDPTYPKTESAVLTATFCEPATGSPNVDGITGLPGPGALVLPVTATFSR